MEGSLYQQLGMNPLGLILLSLGAGLIVFTLMMILGPPSNWKE